MGFLEKINEIDQSIFLFLNGKHSPFWDVAMSLFTRTETWSIFFLVIIYFIIREYRAKSVIILIILALAILISDQLSVFFKETFHRLRPSHDPTIQSLVHTVMKKGGLYGFFSSHATNTFAVAMLLSRVFKNYRFTVLIFSWAAFVSYTRIYLGLHYPGDIVTGMFVGSLIGLGLSALNNLIDCKIYPFRTPRLEITKLKKRENNIILVVFSVLFAMVLLVVNRLQHTQFL